MSKIIVTVEKTNTRFSAGADKYPVYTAGNSLQEINEHITHALNLNFKHNKKTLIKEDAVKLKIDMKPSELQTKRILQGVQKLGKELASINF